MSDLVRAIWRQAVRDLEHAGSDHAGVNLIDGSIRDAAGRACDIIPWTAPAWAAARAAGNPFVPAILREGVELWHAPGVAPLPRP